MAGVSFPVTRSAGEALVVASPSVRPQAVAALGTLGFAVAEFDDPYAAMAELCRRPMVFRAVILSLAGLYTEELEIISAIKRRFPQVEIWLTHTDGRYSALAEAMRLGADGLLAEDGLHRIAGAPRPSAGSSAANGEDASNGKHTTPRPISETPASAPADSLPPSPRGLATNHSSTAARPASPARPLHSAPSAPAPVATPPADAATHAPNETETDLPQSATTNGHSASADSIFPAHVSHALNASPPSNLREGSPPRDATDEPVLTADELRALLQETPPTEPGTEELS